MGSLSTRRVVRRTVATPAKITIVDGGSRKGRRDSSSNKENTLNCSLYSLFESHYERSKDSLSTPRHHHPQSASNANDGKGVTPANNILQPRKRSHNNNSGSTVNQKAIPSATGAVAAAAEEQRFCELSPPELTTSDTFKPAKRILAPNVNKAVEESCHTQLPDVETSDAASPVAVSAARESCDVLVSSPREESKKKKIVTPTRSAGEPQRASSRVYSSGGRRDIGMRRTPSQGTRRFSVVRLSIARDGGGSVGAGGTFLSSGRNGGSSSSKKQQPRSNDGPAEASGKDMVFATRKGTSVREPEQSSGAGAQADGVVRARSRVVERRKSICDGVGSLGGRLGLLKKECSDKVSPLAAAGASTNPPHQQQQTKPAGGVTKVTAESIRTRKLSMVLKSEQRLAEKNEQYKVQFRHLQEEMEKKDHEMEKLRSAALMLNNMIHRQGEEIRELRVRLKETFNENAEVRDLCESLERELRKTRETLKQERIQTAITKPSDIAKLPSLASRFQSLAIRTLESPGMEPCIEGDYEGPDDRDDFATQTLPAEEAVGAESTECNGDASSSQKDEDTEEYTLQDLQEMVVQEENLLKERCANALKELNLPLTSLLSTKGSLDVGSLKTVLRDMSSGEEDLTAERMSSIRKISAWIGST